jgi:hypothetical protein
MMRSYAPNCAVWMNGRKVEPTQEEVIDHNATVAAILAKEKEMRSQPVVPDDEEIPQIDEAADNIEEFERHTSSMLLDPAMLESDVDL